MHISPECEHVVWSFEDTFCIESTSQRAHIEMALHQAILRPIAVLLTRVKRSKTVCLRVAVFFVAVCILASLPQTLFQRPDIAATHHVINEKRIDEKKSAIGKIDITIEHIYHS